MNQEINGKRVKVLPIVIDDCELPGFLLGKLFGDFRTPEEYLSEFLKLLRRLGKILPGTEAFESETMPIAIFKQKIEGHNNEVVSLAFRPTEEL